MPNDPTRRPRERQNEDIEQAPAATNACRAATARPSGRWDLKTRTAACGPARSVHRDDALTIRHPDRSLA